MMHIQMVLVMVTVPDINRNLSGKWHSYGNSTCSAWLSYEGCTEEERLKVKRLKGGTIIILWIRIFSCGSFCP